MKPTIQKRILIACSLLVMAGALLFTTSCGPGKHKIDDSTVLPFKDKAELDKLLNLPILPEYTIEEYYTKTDFIYKDERFIVCCKFQHEIPPAEVKKIMAQVNNSENERWYTYMDEEERLCYFLDTTLTASQKRPDILGDNIIVEIEIPYNEKESLRGFEIVFRNNRADFNAVVDRDTLSKILGVEFPPLTETSRVDEDIYYEFDTIPSEEFYQALEKAPNWTVNHYPEDDESATYMYEYDDGNTWTQAYLFKGRTHFSFYRTNSFKRLTDNGLVELMQHIFRNKKQNSESD